MMAMEKATRVVMIGIVGAMVGWTGCVKYYHVQGLWGVQNAALHSERVIVPTLAKAASEAVVACEANAGAALDNDASVADLKRCPAIKLPQEASK